MKKLFAFACFSLLSLFAIMAQGVLTAPNYFQAVSAEYAKISDYEADVDVKINKKIMKAHVSFKRPNLLRMDFSSPDKQAIVFNGDQLTVYLPDSNAILNQTVPAGTNSANLATAQGLSLLSRYYIVSYEVGPDPVPLSDESEESVIKLSFKRRSVNEAFKSISMAIDVDTNLIRMIEATNGQNEVFSMEFTNYDLNKSIPKERFIYTPPSSANEYNNFLFSE